jgi:putative transposase
MANTYSQIHLQFIFVVKYRRGLIDKSWKTELYKYMTTCIQKHGHKVLIINGIEDHVHLFVGFRPSQSISSLAQEVKAATSKWINETKYLNREFRWQSGYAVFSYSLSEVPRVISYIKNQEAHHQKKTFQKEHLELLKEFNIEYQQEYLFHVPL